MTPAELQARLAMRALRDDPAVGPEAVAAALQWATGAIASTDATPAEIIDLARARLLDGQRVDEGRVGWSVGPVPLPPLPAPAPTAHPSPPPSPSPLAAATARARKGGTAPRPAPVAPSGAAPGGRGAHVERRNITAPPLLWEAIDARADALGLDRSGYIRHAVREEMVRAGVAPPVEVRARRGPRVGGGDRGGKGGGGDDTA